jgi:hypothetical protein
MQLALLVAGRELVSPRAERERCDRRARAVVQCVYEPAGRHLADFDQALPASARHQAAVGRQRDQQQTLTVGVVGTPKLRVGLVVPSAELAASAGGDRSRWLRRDAADGRTKIDGTLGPGSAGANLL